MSKNPDLRCESKLCCKSTAAVEDAVRKELEAEDRSLPELFKEVLIKAIKEQDEDQNTEG